MVNREFRVSPLKKKHIELVFGVKSGSKYEFQSSDYFANAASPPGQKGGDFEQRAAPFVRLSDREEPRESACEMYTKKGSVPALPRFSVHLRGLQTSTKTFTPLRKHSPSSGALPGVNKNYFKS